MAALQDWGKHSPFASPAESRRPDAWDAVANAWTAWSTRCADASCTSTSWSEAAPNVVWGSHCGGADCADVTWWLADDDQTVVWGTDDDATVVWGTDDDHTVVWGTDDDETVVWGTSCGQACEPVIWNR